MISLADLFKLTHNPSTSTWPLIVLLTLTLWLWNVNTSLIARADVVACTILCAPGLVDRALDSVECDQPWACVRVTRLAYIAWLSWDNRQSSQTAWG